MAWRAISKSGMFDLGKRFEIIPVVACVGAVCLGATVASIYSFFKLDVQLNHKSAPRHEGVDLMNPTSKKLITINQKYEPMPELHNLLAEIKAEEEKQAKEPSSH